MKKSIFIISIMSAIVLISCQKQKNEPSVNSITNAPIEKQYAYVRENFKKIIDGLAPLFKDQEFRKYLYSEASKKYHGENVVLVETIMNSPFKAQMHYNDVSQGVNAFKNIDGENYHPQLYFPYFDKPKPSKNSRLNYDDGAEVVFYDGDESVTTVPIYQYSASLDSFILTDSYADETYAQTHDLIIIGINEDDDPGEEFDPGKGDDIDDIQSTINFRIDKMNVKDGKESWLAGATEVRIKALGTTWSHIENGNTSGNFVTIPPNLHYTTDNKGDLVKKIVRGEIGYPILNFNYPMNKDWEVGNYFVDPIVYPYVIFEYDAWPAAIKTLGSKIPTATITSYQTDFIQFRSSNSPFGHLSGSSWLNYAIYGNVSGSPSNNYQLLYSNGHRVNTDDIEFTTQHY